MRNAASTELPFATGTSGHEATIVAASNWAALVTTGASHGTLYDWRSRTLEHKGKLVRQKAPWKLKELRAIRVRFQLARRHRDRRCSTRLRSGPEALGSPASDSEDAKEHALRCTSDLLRADIIRASHTADRRAPNTSDPKEFAKWER